MRDWLVGTWIAIAPSVGDFCWYFHLTCDVISSSIVTQILNKSNIIIQYYTWGIKKDRHCRDFDQKWQRHQSLEWMS